MFVTPTAHEGCYLAIPDSDGKFPVWCYGIEEYASDGVEVPEIALDPDDGVISLINVSKTAKTYFVTVEECKHVIGADECDLLAETHTSSGREYVTFIAMVYPNQILGLAQLIPKKVGKNRRKSLSSIRISSDIQEYIPLPPHEPTSVFVVNTFPLSPVNEESFLCTQSSGGSLTHFAHPSTYYAVDFRCQVGTPVIAVFDGKVVEIRNDSSDSGVHVSNLFGWNSIMIQSSDQRWYAEYVHIKKDSFMVSVGDSVACGQVICSSGDVGFCPEPHLHFEVHVSKEPGAVSVPLVSKDGISPFIVDQFYS